jgi:hypothetical protein
MDVTEQNVRFSWRILYNVILAVNRKLPDDDVLTSKHVEASYIYIYVIN